MMSIGKNFSVHPYGKITDRPIEYIRPKAAAEYLGISQSCLAKLRMRANRANGPQFLKQGGSVIYRRCDLDAWMNQHLVGGI